MQASHVAWMSRTSLMVAVMLAAWVAARSTWVVLQADLVLPQLEVASVEPQKATIDKAALIRDAHLFGVPEAVKAQPAPVVRKNSATLSQFILLGLLAEGDGTGSAVIATQSRATDGKIYHDGDALPGVGQIHSILGDHIVVNVGGGLEKLYLKKPLSDQSAPVVTPPVGTVGNSLASFRQTIKQNPSQLEKHFTARPVNRDGATIGYAVRSRGAYRSLFRETGLRDGDIVTEVNGIKLNGVTGAMGVYKEILGARELNATILRGDRTLLIRRLLD